MAPPKRQGVTAGGSDFKRRKAKVGKAAPKKLNETETDFKAASINVSKQDRGGTVKSALSSDVLVSTRGKTLQEFTGKIQHPAVAVRISVSKGLKDMICGVSDSQQLFPHVSQIVPLIGKCLVDEDPVIRSNGISVMTEVLTKLQNSATRTLAPFASLMAAYLTLAIDSLDRDTRKDAVTAILRYASHVPTLIKLYAWKILPGLCRLIGDPYFQYTVSVNNGKEKIKKDDARRLRFSSLIQAIFNLLQSLEPASPSEVSRQSSVSIPSFRVTDRSRNGFVFVRKHRISNFNASRPSILTTPSNYQPTESQERYIAFDLLEKLQGSFLIFHGEASSRRMTNADEEIFLLLLKTVRNLLQWISTYFRSPEDLSADQGKKLTVLSKSILDIFPRSGSYSDDAIVGTNAELCIILHHVSCLQKSSMFSEKIQAQILKFIKRLIAAVSQIPYSEIQGCCSQLFRVMSILSANSSSVQLQQLSQALLDLFCDRTGDLVKNIDVLLRREVCTYATAVLEKDGFLESNIIDNKTRTNILCLMLKSLGSSMNEDMDMKVLLFDIIQDELRNLDRFSIKETNALRTCTEELFQRRERGHSPFEIMEETFQRRILALIVILGNPSKETLETIASFCAKSLFNKRSSMMIYCVNAIHRIRMTISMQAYFGFLIDSTGILTHPWTKVLFDGESTEEVNGSLEVFDQGLKEVCWCLASCGKAKSLRLIYRVLDNLIHDSSESLTFGKRCVIQIIAALVPSQDDAVESEKIFSIFSDEFMASLRNLIDLAEKKQVESIVWSKTAYTTQILKATMFRF